MLTPYERSQLERAVDCIRAGCCPKNLDELAGILEHCLMADRRVAKREHVYKTPASGALIEAIKYYGLFATKGDTVGALLTSVVDAESFMQKIEEGTRRLAKSNRAGG